MSDKRRLLVERLTDDAWDDEKEFDEFFATVESADELHYFADRFNWDAGHDELLCVLAHALCDKGTAFLIYWRASPAEFYYRYASRDEVESDWELESWDLLKLVESKVEQDGFRTHDLTYDPRPDGFFKEHTKFWKGRIPDTMIPTDTTGVA